MPLETMKGNTEANNLPKNAAEALKFAQNRHNFVTQNREQMQEEYLKYHESILLKPNEKEIPGKHWMRFHRGPDIASGEKRRLIVIVGGNKENLVPESNLRKLEYQKYLQHNKLDSVGFKLSTHDIFDALKNANQSGVDIVQVRIAETSAKSFLGGSDNPSYTQDVAMTHIGNVLCDAFNGRGLFEDVEYADVSLYGYSYGAGVIHDLTAKDWARLRRQDTSLQIPPLARTAYGDGIKFQSTKAEAITSRPSSKEHIHFIQEEQKDAKTKEGYFTLSPIALGKPLDRKPGDAPQGAKTLELRIPKVLLSPIERTRQEDYKILYGTSPHHFLNVASSERSTTYYKPIARFLLTGEMPQWEGAKTEQR